MVICLANPFESMQEKNAYASREASRGGCMGTQAHLNAASGRIGCGEDATTRAHCAGEFIWATGVAAASRRGN
jgi:hypothetical protein